MEELLAVRLLVLESQKPEYAGFGWSGGRHNNPKVYQFSSVINVQPSTMQTKIRTMIRHGFLKEGNTCPLHWTPMGDLWNNLHSIGNYDAAKHVYELTLAISLALYAFNNSVDQFSINPHRGEMPLKFLLSILDKRQSISLSEFEILVDGSTTRIGTNASYWKADLINSGLFQEERGRLVYTGKYPNFIRELNNLTPNPLLEDHDWRAIRENPIIEISPFKDSVLKIFEQLAIQQNIRGQINDGILTEPLVNVVARQKEIRIPEIDILSTDLRFSESPRRIRNATWGLRIKRDYDYLCSVPNCDVIGSIFVEAAHIKPDNVLEGDTPHRAHILNGLCLCRNCHIAFDKGYFSLTDDHNVIISSKFDAIPEQHLKTVILSSANTKIKSRNDSRYPLAEFIQYHRMNSFQA